MSGHSLYEGREKWASQAALTGKTPVNIVLIRPSVSPSSAHYLLNPSHTATVTVFSQLWKEHIFCPEKVKTKKKSSCLRNPPGDTRPPPPTPRAHFRGHQSPPWLSICAPLNSLRGRGRRGNGWPLAHLSAQLSARNPEQLLRALWPTPAV